MKNALSTPWNAAHVASWLRTIKTLRSKHALPAYIRFDELRAMLSQEQNRMVSDLLAIKPSAYGLTTPFSGLDEVPEDLVTVHGQHYLAEGKTKTLHDPYLPRKVHDAFAAMKAAFETDYPGRTLLVESGYRSPAYQVVVFFNWLARFYDGDVAKTLHHVALPAYSQHCSATHTALDIENIEGLPTNQDLEGFKDTIEYHWLAAHAADFGFYESYPKDNQEGMRWEPWHWQYLA
ncbi:MAG: M15 family metallopeptidase [Candidatus Saccharibacteria bacterium]